MQYIFSGRTGEKVSVRFDVKSPPLKVNLSGVEGQTCEVALLLSGSIDLVVSVTTQKPISDLATFRNQITTLCKGIYDAATFLNCVSLEVELNSVLEVETKRFWTFEDRVPELQQSASERPLETEAFFNLAITNGYLRSALSDLNSAIRFPNDTGFYCYRAIEALMQDFKQPGEESKLAWPKLREALQVTQDWIQPLTESSMFNRHGELKGVSGSERTFLMKRAWTIVYRFARLKLLNVAKLPNPEFPVLDK
jgi:hypothetical protein